MSGSDQTRPAERDERTEWVTPQAKRMDAADAENGLPGGGDGQFSQS